MRLSYKLLATGLVGFGLLAALQMPAFSTSTRQARLVAHPTTWRIIPRRTLRHAAKLRHARFARQLHELWNEIRLRFPASQDRELVVVDVRTQKLYLLEHGQIADRWPVSTSVKGTNQVARSDGTPLGVFRIARKLGTGLPAGAILRDQAATGHIAVSVDAPDDLAASGLITTRILWLSGLEPNWNEGGDVDTFLRHIYIHGTPNLGMLGQPASHGCVQMAPHAVMALYHAVPLGTPVAIIPGTGSLAAIPGAPVVG